MSLRAFTRTAAVVVGLGLGLCRGPAAAQSAMPAAQLQELTMRQQESQLLHRKVDLRDRAAAAAVSERR